MLKNMGPADRVIRFLLALLVVVLYFTDQISGTAALILGIIAVAFFVTSFMRFCPIYLPFNIKTCKEPS